MSVHPERIQDLILATQDEIASSDGYVEGILSAVLRRLSPHEQRNWVMIRNAIMGVLPVSNVGNNPTLWLQLDEDQVPPKFIPLVSGCKAHAKWMLILQHLWNDNPPSEEQRQAFVDDIQSAPSKKHHVQQVTKKFARRFGLLEALDSLCDCEETTYQLAASVERLFSDEEFKDPVGLWKLIN